MNLFQLIPIGEVSGPSSPFLWLWLSHNPKNLDSIWTPPPYKKKANLSLGKNGIKQLILVLFPNPHNSFLLYRIGYNTCKL